MDCKLGRILTTDDFKYLARKVRFFFDKSSGHPPPPLPHAFYASWSVDMCPFNQASPVFLCADSVYENVKLAVFCTAVSSESFLHHFFSTRQLIPPATRPRSDTCLSFQNRNIFCSPATSLIGGNNHTRLLYVVPQVARQVHWKSTSLCVKSFHLFVYLFIYLFIYLFVNIYIAKRMWVPGVYRSFHFW